jgi:hypothetical protein
VPLHPGAHRPGFTRRPSSRAPGHQHRPGSARCGGRWWPLDARFGRQREAAELIEADLHQPYPDGVTRTSTAGEPGGRYPTPARSAVATDSGLLDIPLGLRARRRHPDHMRLGSRAADACRRTPPSTAANARAAACGGASHPTPPARSPVRTSRRPQGDKAGGDPPGPAAAAVTADWSPMLHAAWSRTASAWAFTAEGCAVRRTQRRPPTAPAVLPVGPFRPAGTRSASMPGSTPRSSTAATQRRPRPVNRPSLS